LFRLSKITDYGIVLLTQLASAEGDAPHNARELAAEVELPLPVVSKILKSLARRNLLSSQRGAKGGFRLSRPAHMINVTEMIEALEGPVALTECSIPLGACSHQETCRVRDPWQVINRVVHDALRQITLADLAGPDFVAEGQLAQVVQLGDVISKLNGRDGQDHPSE
jgi:FeS assembly SUF system regulator